MSDPASVPNTISSLLATQARQRPQAAAILGPGGRVLSYDALWAQVQCTAASLQELGLGRSDCIVLVIPNGPLLATAFLAAACTATAAPLNPAYGEREFGFYMSHLGARALLIPAGLDSPARAVAASKGIAILELASSPDAEPGLFAIASTRRIVRPTHSTADPQDVALVLYTSGTTSQPKAVPLTHANLCASAQHVCRSLHLTSQDRCLNVMPLFHIHGLVAALLASVAAGASVYCAPELDVTRFFPYLAESQATWYTAVPTMHQTIVDQAARQPQCVRMAQLRFARSCSAPLSPRLMATLEDTLGIPLIEAYGMTEAAHQITSNPLPPNSRKPASVGLPTGTEVRSVDEQGCLLPAGEVGEVVIRGPNVMSGYLNNPEANASSFFDDWFRTGDLGYLDGDGYLYLAGRLKEIINRGGQKVNPLEVDQVLLEHPSVAQAATFAVPHPTLGEDVAAAVTPRQGVALDEAELRAFAFGKLAPFKVPTRILLVSNTPKGPTGKIQRLSLAQSLSSRLSPEFVAPRTIFEEILSQLWRQLLQVDRIGAYDNFFALGGDSLQATRLVSRVRATLGVELPVASIFRTPTLADQATMIEQLLPRQLESLSGEEQDTRYTSDRGQLAKLPGSPANHGGTDG